MPPQPLFFVIRPGYETITTTGELIAEPDTIVPLIPIDQLPDYVEVVGVPRRLRHGQVARMHNLGVLHSDGDTYQLRFRQMSDSNHGEPSSDKAVRSPTSAASPSSLPVQESKSSRDGKARSKGLANSRHTPYCRNWCHHGTCKWGRSCRFQHIMPSSAEELATIGLKEKPVWFRAAESMLQDMGLPISRQVRKSPAKKKNKKEKKKVQNGNSKYGGGSGDVDGGNGSKKGTTASQRAPQLPRPISSGEDSESDIDLEEDADDEKGSSTIPCSNNECLIDLLS